ncbi:hypothetical protein NDU88_003335 [Pleurodeles waltl]|uniref:Uncharacterized protein n=1 Tax=Pleurodeles waltl TaxID=8319 RepID=A0AAV7T5W5_PLEWA|nr:hypothetical protein NDU88_003335 [Pleurodeles waltl]
MKDFTPVQEQMQENTCKATMAYQQCKPMIHLFANWRFQFTPAGGPALEAHSQWMIGGYCGGLLPTGLVVLKEHDVESSAAALGYKLEDHKQ